MEEMPRGDVESGDCLKKMRLACLRAQTVESLDWKWGLVRARMSVWTWLEGKGGRATSTAQRSFNRRAKSVMPLGSCPEHQQQLNVA